jgi:hypothetical protein
VTATTGILLYRGEGGEGDERATRKTDRSKRTPTLRNDDLQLSVKTEVTFVRGAGPPPWGPHCSVRVDFSENGYSEIVLSSRSVSVYLDEIMSAKHAKYLEDVRLSIPKHGNAVDTFDVPVPRQSRGVSKGTPRFKMVPGFAQIRYTGRDSSRNKVIFDCPRVDLRPEEDDQGQASRPAGKEPVAGRSNTE